MSRHPDPQTLRELRALLAADFERVVRQTNGGAAVSRARRVLHLMLPAMQCAILHRGAHWLHRRGHRRLAGSVAALSTLLTGAMIHPGSRIGPGLVVPHTVRVGFCAHAGRDLILLPACVVGPETLPLLSEPFPQDVPRLGDNVVIGARCSVAGRVDIGDGALVGVGVVAARDVPAGSMAAYRSRQRLIGPAAGGA